MFFLHRILVSFFGTRLLARSLSGESLVQSLVHSLFMHTLVNHLEYYTTPSAPGSLLTTDTAPVTKCPDKVWVSIGTVIILSHGVNVVVN